MAREVGLFTRGRRRPTRSRIFGDDFKTDAHIFGVFPHEGLVELFMGFQNCLVCTLLVAVVKRNSCFKSGQNSAHFVLEGGREKQLFSDCPPWGFI